MGTVPRMQSKAGTVKEYVASLPEDRRQAIESLRAVINKHKDPSLEEGMQYGMIGYYVPHSVFEPGYHCDPRQPLPYAGLASQKQHMSLYLMSVYGDDAVREWFTTAWRKTGKKLDMGKACIRFKKLEDIPLDVIGEAFRRFSVKEYVRRYTAQLALMGKAPGQKSSAAKGDAKPAAKKTGPKKKAVAAKAASSTAKPTNKTASKKAPSRTARAGGR